MQRVCSTCFLAVLWLAIGGGAAPPGAGVHGADPHAGTLPAAPATAPARLHGVIPAALTRPMKATDDPKLQSLLKQYAEPPGDVPWTMTKLRSTDPFDIYDLRFPSPVVTAAPENNTVCCEYYRCRGDQKRPAVVVLHILDGRFTESRVVCSYLAASGIDGLLVKMAYYGPRRPKDAQRLRTFMRDLETMRTSVRQSAMDARRAARWLESQPQVDAERISLLGTSLGGFVGSVASGVDGRFHRSVFILAGGHLEQIILGPSREVRAPREAFQASGLTAADLARELAVVEPCTFAGRIDPRSVVMVNTKDDPVVPPANAQALADAIGGVPIRWYAGDHYALIWKLPEVLAWVTGQLAK